MNILWLSERVDSSPVHQFSRLALSKGTIKLNLSLRSPRLRLQMNIMRFLQCGFLLVCETFIP